MEKNPQCNSSCGCFLGWKALQKAKAGGRAKFCIMTMTNADFGLILNPLQTKRLTYAERLAWHGEHLKDQERQVHSVGLAGLKAVLTVGSFRSSELPTQPLAFDCYCDERLQQCWGWFWEDLYFWWSCKKCTMLWTAAACRDEVANTAAVQTQDRAIGTPAILWQSPSVLHLGHSTTAAIIHSWRSMQYCVVF